MNIISLGNRNKVCNWQMDKNDDVLPTDYGKRQDKTGQ